VVGAAGASGVDVSSDPPSSGAASSLGGSPASADASPCPGSVLSAVQARSDEATSDAATIADRWTERK
jgi:hypothetical protein